MTLIQVLAAGKKKKDAPSATANPTLSGYSTVGYTLTATTGTWDNNPDSYTYQWYNGAGAISGATNSTYTTQTSDKGYQLYCIVTAVNEGGSSTSTSTSSATCYAIPTNTSAPSHNYAGAYVAIGNTISISSYGTWSETILSYTVYWYNDIGGAPLGTGTSYTTTSGDNGRTIRALVFANSGADAGQGSAYTGYSLAVGYAPVATVAPVISGTTKVGQTLSCTTGSWNYSPTSYLYYWQRNTGTVVQYNSSPTYVLQAGDVGSTIHCIVYATNTYGTGGSSSAYTGTVTATNPTPSVEYLVVAGGGSGGVSSSGGTYWGAGGGAGGYRTGTGFPVTTGSPITVTVGSGGTAAGAATGSNSGLNSVFGTITSTGGGGGGFYAPGSNPKTGGSGGGGIYTTGTGGAGTSGQGNNGGAGTTAAYYGTGGGGGAGGVGGSGSASVGGTGGAGSSSSISGAAVVYAAGGGGGIYTATYQGGAGGSSGVGGTASKATPATAAAAGQVNTGSGGGGQGSGRAESSGAGGSGVVIIRYSNTYDDASSTTGSPSYTNAGGYKVYKWTGSGSITF